MYPVVTYNSIHDIRTRYLLTHFMVNVFVFVLVWWHQHDGDQSRESSQARQYYDCTRDRYFLHLNLPNHTIMMWCDVSNFSYFSFEHSIGSHHIHFYVFFIITPKSYKCDWRRLSKSDWRWCLRGSGSDHWREIDRVVVMSVNFVTVTASGYLEWFLKIHSFTFKEAQINFNDSQFV